MTDPHATASAYLELWNDADEASRHARLRDGWSADARYVDAIMHGAEHDGIAAMITGARAQFPRHSFALSGTPDGFGDFVRFSWTLAAEDGAAVAGGTDVVRLDETGRIVEVIGFIDKSVA